jgi:hypothetical protein
MPDSPTFPRKMNGSLGDFDFYPFIVNYLEWQSCNRFSGAIAELRSFVSGEANS